MKPVYLYFGKRRPPRPTTPLGSLCLSVYLSVRPARHAYLSLYSVCLSVCVCPCLWSPPVSCMSVICLSGSGCLSKAVVSFLVFAPHVSAHLGNKG